MKKISLLLISFLLINTGFAASKVCVTVVNNSQSQITASTPAGRVFFIPPYQTFIFPESEMGAVCERDDNHCFVMLQDAITYELTLINRFPSGAKITYHAVNKYELEPHADNICLN